MAKTESTTVVQTVACDLGRCGSCKGVVLSLTTVGLTDCRHGCHTPDPIQDQELDDLLEQDDTRDDAWTAWSR